MPDFNDLLKYLDSGKYSVNKWYQQRFKSSRYSKEIAGRWKNSDNIGDFYLCDQNNIPSRKVTLY